MHLDPATAPLVARIWKPAMQQTRRFALRRSRELSGL